MNYFEYSVIEWPEHVWLGVTVEGPRQVHRIEDLRQTKAETKLLVCEPLLGPLGDIDLAGISWVVAGGEYGPHEGNRSTKPEWVLDLRRKCTAANIPFNFNENGGVVPGYQPWPRGSVEQINEIPRALGDWVLDDSLYI